MKTIESFNNIKDWNLSEVKRYMVLRSGVTEAEADELETEYKRFLALAITTDPGKNFPVSIALDPFWHTHILFTHNYTRMCHRLGGAYIHHIPAVTDEERTSLYADYEHNTLPAYREAFGTPNEKYWPKEGQICIACCDRDSVYSIGRDTLSLTI